MRLSRTHATANWKYAIGEVFLIVVGITLALMANSWYENWQERRYEVLVLRQIRDALESDLGLFDNYFGTLQQSERDLAELLNRLRSGDPFSSETGSYFYAVILWRGGVRMRMAPYEELRNRGFSLISNASLRTELIDLYEDKFPALRGTSELDRDFSRDQVQPYFNTRFRGAENGEWFPIDYDALRSDLYFENLVLIKLRRLRVFLLPRYNEVISTIRDVLNDIETEIDGPAR